jgi:hypothetical protein
MNALDIELDARQSGRAGDFVCQSIEPLMVKLLTRQDRWLSAPAAQLIVVLETFVYEHGANHFAAAATERALNVIG